MAKKKKKAVVVSEPLKQKFNFRSKPRGKSFEAGNQWWSWRSKHGADRLFKSPADLWNAALEYFTLCDENPEKRAELVKYEGGAQQVEVDVKRLYTLYGLTAYCHINTEYFRQFKNALDLSKQVDYDFSRVIKLIEESILNQQVSGAASGFFNGNIISRLNGLVDRKDVTTADLPLTPPAPTVVSSGPKLASSEDDVSLDRDK